ncbi:hypothetical protein BaRGS_00030991 [Batillaria attramentaria]|uniref:Uncharacterized protein n=1 Tax=Batillaria attramentaria TaxID=370345 RepID=A0ABD0JTA7_9CAEN
MPGAARDFAMCHGGALWTAAAADERRRGATLGLLVTTLTTTHHRSLSNPPPKLEPRDVLDSQLTMRATFGRRIVITDDCIVEANYEIVTNELSLIIDTSFTMDGSLILDVSALVVGADAMTQTVRGDRHNTRR